MVSPHLVCYSLTYHLAPSDHGNTPAHCACEKGRAECVNCLVCHGADVNLTNHRALSALDSAKRGGHPRLVERAGTVV